MSKTSSLPVYTLRGHKLVLDADLAAMYQVSTKRLMEQVRRNPGRFPPDICFRLTLEEMADLRPSGSAADEAMDSPPIRKTRGLPFAFTIEGVLLASFVLNTPAAIAVSVWLVRLYCLMRDVVASSRQGAAWLAELEEYLGPPDPAVTELQAVFAKFHARSPAPAKRPTNPPRRKPRT